MTRRPNTACHERASTPGAAGLSAGRERAGRSAASDASASECLTIAPEVEPESTTTLLTDRVLVFRIADQHYALPIDRVQEVQRICAFAADGFGGSVVGMVDLRGSVIAAVDVHALLGLGPGDLTLDTQMVIFAGDGDIVALLVDKVNDVVVLPEGSLRSAPKRHALAAKTLGVMGSGDELVLVLDMASLLADADELAGTSPAHVGREAAPHEA